MSRRIRAGLLATAVLLAASLLPATASAARGDMVGGRFSDCFWNYGAFGVHDFNIAYPDAGATVWFGVFRMAAWSATLRRNPSESVLSGLSWRIGTAGCGSGIRQD